MLRFSLRTFLVVCVALGLLAVIVTNKFRRRTPKSVPADILQKINDDFGYFKTGDEAQEIIEELWERDGIFAVGTQQYCRAILFLADGDIEELRRLAEVPEDARDILIRADNEAGSPGHCFGNGFAFE